MNLRKIRKSRGLTMKELGRRVGVTEAAIGQYETGKRKPSYEMLLKLSEELNCSVNDILKTPEEISEEEEMLDELRAMHTDVDMRVLMDSFKKMSPLQIKMMRSFAETLLKDYEFID